MGIDVSMDQIDQLLRKADSMNRQLESIKLPKIDN
jgi:hypothetical protein